MKQAIYEQFLRSCKCNGSGEALIDGDVRLTYDELRDAIVLAATSLRERGVGRNSFVALLFPNGWEFVATLYALFALGAVPVLLNTRLTAAEVTEQLQASGAGLLVSARALEGLATEAVPQGVPLAVFEEAIPSRSGAVPLAWLPPAEVDADDVGLVMFTSGSTGTAKAVAVCQRALGNKLENFFASDNVYQSDDAFLLFNPLFHQGGFSFLVFLLSSGAKVVLQKSLRASYVVDALEREGITQMLLLPPSLCNRIKECPGCDEMSFPRVRGVTLTGGRALEGSARDVFALFPAAQLLVGYGHTEGAASLSLRISREDYEVDPQLVDFVGRPDPGCEVQLLDEQLRPVGPGRPGQLWARSSAMFEGYLGRETPVRDGWFPTGDLLECDGRGLYRFVGRCRDMVKTGGENVYADEVERVIERHPAVREAAVFALPDEYLGEAIAAAVVLEPEGRATPEELVRWCRASMASYKKPRAWVLCKELPVTSTGKKDRRALRRRYEADRSGLWQLSDGLNGRRGGA